MNFMETPQQSSEESVTFIIKRSSKNVFFAKMIILVGLTLLGGYAFTQHGAQQYERGRALTQEEYLERFDQYKSTLLNAKQYDNPIASTFIMLIIVSFFIGSYELTAVIIGFLIGKVIRQ